MPDSVYVVCARCLQERRAQALVAGEPWALASATPADVAALTPAQVMKVTQHARQIAPRGAQLAAQLFQTDSAGSGPLLPRIARLPADDRAALAWVALRGEAGPDGSAAGARGAEQFSELLVAEFTQRAAGAAAETSASAQAAADLAHVIAIEHQAAELDYMSSM